MEYQKYGNLPPVFLCIKDIAKITGKSRRTAGNLARDIKQKTGTSFVTIDAFCEHTGVKFETIIYFFQNNEK